MSGTNERSALSIAQRQFDATADALGLDDSLRAVLHELNLTELERLTRRFTTEISLIVGPDRDIPAPDLGTGPQVMAWIMDTLSMHAGFSVPASVTGKPQSIGGSEGRFTGPGRGVTF